MLDVERIEFSRRTQRVLGDFREAQSTEDLWTIAAEHLSAQGVPMFGYHHYPPVGAGSDDAPQILTHGFPDAWRDRYISMEMYRFDPIPTEALRQTQPFYWSEILELRPLSKRQAKFISELSSQHLGDGLAVQVFGPSGRNGYWGFGTGGPKLRFGGELQLELQTIGQAFHLRFSRVVVDALPKSTPLTGRETEILEWVARGKSNSVIAEILGISQHTVDAYLRRIFAKFGVTDRVSAVLRGFGTGAI